MPRFGARRRASSVGSRLRRRLSSRRRTTRRGSSRRGRRTYSRAGSVYVNVNAPSSSTGAPPMPYGAAIGPVVRSGPVGPGPTSFRPPTNVRMTPAPTTPERIVASPPNLTGTPITDLNMTPDGAIINVPMPMPPTITSPSEVDGHTRGDTVRVVPAPASASGWTRIGGPMPSGRLIPPSQDAIEDRAADTRNRVRHFGQFAKEAGQQLLDDRLGGALNAVLGGAYARLGDDPNRSKKRSRVEDQTPVDPFGPGAIVTHPGMGPIVSHPDFADAELEEYDAEW